MTDVLMAECTGLWRRTLLVDTDGAQDTTTDVRWLQGINAFVDLRRPAGRPDFTDTRCAVDYTVPQQEWASTQDGFAGRLGQRGDIFEWSRFVNLQPPGPNPDAGRMHWEADTLIEVGVHADYVEHYARDSAAVTPCWALTLRTDADDEALILRVGNLFGWASRIATDAEISLGAVDAGSWLITDSSLPYREAHPLRPRLQGDELFVDDVNGDGKAVTRRWRVTESEGSVNL
ncbi:MAG: hypothetical protein JWR37_4194 [Mycobacterium sp.]|nr:hypothetical protein [Mycobacterium sp.]